MKQQDYHNSVTSPAGAKETFEHITNVGDWWTTSFKGNAKKLNDVFSVTFGKTYVNFKVIEIIPGNKIVWLVTDCYLDWLNNKTEWNDTKIIWQLTGNNNQTKVEMTHLGLVPDIECYDNCRKGWDFYIEKSLFNLLTENKGMPDKG